MKIIRVTPAPAPVFLIQMEGQTFTVSDDGLGIVPSNCEAYSPTLSDDYEVLFDDTKESK